MQVFDRVAGGRHCVQVFDCITCDRHCVQVFDCITCDRHCTCDRYCVQVLPPKYEDVLQMSEDHETLTAAALVSPPSYNAVRATDADNGND